MQLPKVRLNQLFVTLLLLSTTIVEAQKTKEIIHHWRWKTLRCIDESNAKSS